MGNSASSLPYAIGKQVSAASSDGWARHEGSRKSDGANVTVFVAKKPALTKTPLNRSMPHLTQLAPALHHFSYCKKLRHPHILQVMATLDTDHPNDSTSGGSSSSVPTPPPSGGGGGGGGSSKKAETGDLIIVTEPCMTLDTWLQSAPPPEQIAWGLEAIVRALNFLHGSANLAHGNLSPESFVVTPAGDVKLWNLSLLTAMTPNVGPDRHFIDYQSVVTPASYQSPERQEARWDALSACGVHVMDSFGLGVLIPHLFGGHVPQPLVKAVQRLQTPNIKMRPRLQPLLRCPVFDTPYQKLQLQLEEFPVQPAEQKTQFWLNLTPTLQAGLLPQNVIVYRLLPLMKESIKTICAADSMRTQDAYRKEVLSIIQPMFFIAETFLSGAGDDSINKELGDTVGTLFTINDRAIRGSLLQRIGFISSNFDKTVINQRVFEPACSGFSDSSATLRELTLKSTLQLMPNLNQPNLEKLSRYLVRLQGDPEARIRTNTILLFGKLAPHLTDISRSKLLLPAVNRALKDPFVPCRLAALKTTLAAKEFFDPPSIAGKVLPVVTPQLLDPSKEVRRESFVLLDDLIFVLRQESERMNSLPEPEQQPDAAGAPPGTGRPQAQQQPAPQRQQQQQQQQPKAPAPKSGGYLSGISSWMTSSAKPTAAAPAPASAPPPQQQQPQPSYTPAAPLPMAAAATDLSDGWGDDDLDLSMGGVKTTMTTTTAATSNNLFSAPATMTFNNDDDDFFGGFDAKPAKPVVNLRSSGGKLAVPAVKNKAAPVGVTKLTMDDDIEDGWDDF